MAAKTDVSKLADLEAMFKLALDTYGQLAIATNIASSMTNLDEEGSARQALGLATIPHYRKPEEVAQLALFLGSDQSSYVNGQIYTVDGGWTAY